MVSLSNIPTEESLYLEKNNYTITEILIYIDEMQKQGRQIDYVLLTAFLTHSLKNAKIIKFDVCEILISFIVRSNINDVYYLPYLIDLVIERIQTNLFQIDITGGTISAKEERQIKRILTLLIEVYDLKLNKQYLKNLFEALSMVFQGKPFYDVFKKIMENKLNTVASEDNCQVDEGKEINDKESHVTFGVQKQSIIVNLNSQHKQLQLWKTKFKSYDTNRESFFKSYLLNYSEFQKIQDKSSIIEKEVYLPLGGMLLKYDKDNELTKHFKLNNEQDVQDFLKMVNSDPKLQLSWIGSSKNGFNSKKNQIIDLVSGINNVSKILSSLDGGDFTISKFTKSDRYLDIDILFRKKSLHFYIYPNIKGTRYEFLKTDEIFTKVFEYKPISQVLISFNTLLLDKINAKFYDVSVLVIRYLQYEFDIFDTSYKIGLTESSMHFYELKRDFYSSIVSKCGTTNDRYIAGFIMIELVRFFANLIKCNDFSKSEKDELKVFIEQTKRILEEDDYYLFSLKKFIKQEVLGKVQPIDFYHLLSLFTENASKVDSILDFKKWR